MFSIWQERQKVQEKIIEAQAEAIENLKVQHDEEKDINELNVDLLGALNNLPQGGQLVGDLADQMAGGPLAGDLVAGDLLAGGNLPQQPVLDGQQPVLGQQQQQQQQQQFVPIQQQVIKSKD